MVAANLSLCDHIRAMALHHRHNLGKAGTLFQEQVQRVVEQWRNRANAISGQVYQQHAPLIHRYGRWFLVAWLAALADGKLLVAIATSTLTYRLVTKGYAIDRTLLSTVCGSLRSWLAPVTRNPVGASVITFAGTYGLVAAWSELGGRWAATALVGMGLANVMLLIQNSPTDPVDGAQTVGPSSAGNDDQPWQNLTSPDSLKRLLAVRTLLRWCLSTGVGTETYLPGTAVTQRSHLTDCFRVMLTHETEPIVRVALIDGLKALQPKPQLSAGQPALQPLQAHSAKGQRAKIQRAVEYVDPG